MKRSCCPSTPWEPHLSRCPDALWGRDSNAILIHLLIGLDVDLMTPNANVHVTVSKWIPGMAVAVWRLEDGGKRLEQVPWNEKSPRTPVQGARGLLTWVTKAFWC